MFNLTSQERKSLIFVCSLLILGAVVGYLTKKNPSFFKEKNIIYKSSSEKINININEAKKEELVKLYSIGPVLAERIISYRQKNGSFETLKEIKKVKGIGSKKLDKIKENIILP